VFYFDLRSRELSVSEVAPASYFQRPVHPVTNVVLLECRTATSRRHVRTGSTSRVPFAPVQVDGASRRHNFGFVLPDGTFCEVRALSARCFAGRPRGIEMGGWTGCQRHLHWWRSRAVSSCGHRRPLTLWDCPIAAEVGARPCPPQCPRAPTPQPCVVGRHRAQRVEIFRGRQPPDVPFHASAPWPDAARQNSDYCFDRLSPLVPLLHPT